MTELDKIFAQAAEIAKRLPENLQESAFNRALDELLAKGEMHSPVRKTNSKTTRSAVKKVTDTAKDGIDDLVNGINKTKYPDIGDTTRVADRALKVLQLANDDLGIDGLTAAQIADILTRKFRLTANTNGVQVALQRESQTVDVRKGADGKNVFHIMAPGDEYLANLRAGEIQIKAKPKSKAVKKKTQEKKVPKTKRASAEEKSPAGKVTKRKAGKVGPKAAINKLVESGYFNAPRQISAIQEELRHNRGHTFTVQELSPALVRCVRDETLSRLRNESGQYEYSKA